MPEFFKVSGGQQRDYGIYFTSILFLGIMHRGLKGIPLNVIQLNWL